MFLFFYFNVSDGNFNRQSDMENFSDMFVKIFRYSNIAHSNKIEINCWMIEKLLIYSGTRRLIFPGTKRYTVNYFQNSLFPRISKSTINQIQTYLISSRITRVSNSREIRIYSTLSFRPLIEKSTYSTVVPAESAHPVYTQQRAGARII